MLYLSNALLMQQYDSFPFERYTKLTIQRHFVQKTYTTNTILIFTVQIYNNIKRCKSLLGNEK